MPCVVQCPRLDSGCGGTGTGVSIRQQPLTVGCLYATANIVVLLRHVTNFWYIQILESSFIINDRWCALFLYYGVSIKIVVVAGVDVLVICCP